MLAKRQASFTAAAPLRQPAIASWPGYAPWQDGSSFSTRLSWALDGTTAAIWRIQEQIHCRRVEHLRARFNDGLCVGLANADAHDDGDGADDVFRGDVESVHHESFGNRVMMAINLRVCGGGGLCVVNALDCGNGARNHDDCDGLSSYGAIILSGWNGCFRCQSFDCCYERPL